MKQTTETQKNRSHKINAVTTDIDLVNIILADHKPLKQLIKVMKDDETGVEDKWDAFFTFATELTLHAKPEEWTMYRAMKSQKSLREEGFEGDVEHGLADQMCEEIKRTTDTDIFLAKVKVLAELVEHHIEEEESEMLINFGKAFDLEKRMKLGEEYIEFQEKLFTEGGTDSPSESELH